MGLKKANFRYISFAPSIHGFCSLLSPDPIRTNSPLHYIIRPHPFHSQTYPCSFDRENNMTTLKSLLSHGHQPPPTSHPTHIPPSFFPISNLDFLYMKYKIYVIYSIGISIIVFCEKMRTVKEECRRRIITPEKSCQV